MSSETASSSSASKSLMWMTVGLFTGMALLLIVGFFMAKRVLSSMATGVATSKDTMMMPHGKLRLEKQDQIGPGLPVYPSASLEMPESSSVPQALRDSEQGVEIARYHSPDIRDAVDSWYREHLGNEFIRHDAGEQPRPELFSEAHVGEGDVAFVAQRGNQMRIVVLALDDNGTTISLVRKSKAEPQQPAAQ
jgi:hypothetical protein